MEDGFSLKDATVGIFGLGLMGGSLALSLKGKCARLIGFDPALSALELALSKGAVDSAESDSAAFLASVDVLILAAPVPVIIDFIHNIPITNYQLLITNYQLPITILDIGSTKREIVQAMSALPENFDPIGGHPICGKETLGIQNADANLYKDAPFIVTPLARTSQRARRVTRELIAAIGARPIEMTAEEHDRIFAVTSHLPFLLSSALVLSTPPDAAPFIGPGFKSTSRLAGTSSSMMLGVLRSNREHVLSALHGMQSQLAEIEAAVSSEDFTKLESLLNEAQATYHSLTGN